MYLQLTTWTTTYHSDCKRLSAVDAVLILKYIANSFVPAFPATPGMPTPPTQAATAQPNSGAVPAFAAWNSNQFGQILNAFPTRKIQFALKYTF